jgi:hypothetical protein
MHPPEIRAKALALVAAGLNDCKISRRLGIPRRTILDWRRPTYVRRAVTEICPRCWQPAKPIRFTTDDYAELLAMYLGDGCISAAARTSRLRIALDTKYPRIIADAKALLSRCLPKNPIGEVIAHGGSMVFISVYCSHLPCLFPQHGPGMKHQRRIVLEPWQQEIVDAYPWAFIRGCIRTDGCSFINRTNVHRPQPYEYLSYDFSNKSKDIVDLFLEACAIVGIRDCRATYNQRRDLWHVRINRRGSVAEMLEHVGLKE